MSSKTSSPKAKTQRPSRATARLAAVQALYQREMSGDPIPKLLREFHEHRLGRTIEDTAFAPADADFFDDLVSGVAAREAEIDERIAGALAEGWTLDRLDRPMRQILRCGVYELVARLDVPRAAAISEYVDVAKAFYEAREAGFVNGLLDRIAKDVRE
ncbi:transcription antitermination factor NusB [Sphingosinicella microcystinivorans]|uniref:Transcription antitermination protein NusB n=1 Tax=Sphingosinicella microcystinivorans TaxID=335406 RepID=A0AAD1D9P1_SPHMI|nr:transcription antitermination factor NusB [Sphingosinicella microcystinivorans]RKS88002.1 NusB antitermination factor [Sphingosinicella microcystinivorans]BBE35814.1 N utilization substance protein B homolog [Sphingosinicella microcystinivorans]